MGYVDFSESEIEFMASTLYYYHNKYYMTPHEKLLYNNILSKLGSPKSNGSPWNGHYPYVYGDLHKPLHNGSFPSLEAYNKAVKRGKTNKGTKMADYCWFVETEVPPYHEERIIHYA